jgi:hypothetical protein
VYVYVIDEYRIISHFCKGEAGPRAAACCLAAGPGVTIW